MPNYNNQCGQCLHVQNLQGTGDAYVTVIDYEAAGGHALRPICNQHQCDSGRLLIHV